MPAPGDPYDLQRFVEAQDRVIEQVLRELRAGAKLTHWMWFVFPQLRELGRSPTARRFGIGSLAEAIAYRQHPVLGPRLLECTEAVLNVRDRSALEVFGSPDDLKFRSCMTLFERAAPGEPTFGKAIDAYFGGTRDPLTLEILRARGELSPSP